ncbi:MAG: hypothetical protein STHCBS139747_003720 [Sporothrix thermara]
MPESSHLAYLRQALDLARQSPPRPSNFRVGALLVDVAADSVLASGYTLELPGNTHAEQCCFWKLAAAHNISLDTQEDGGGGVESALARLPLDRLPRQLALYTTMEPCSFRASGNLPCVERILRLAGAMTSRSTSARTVTVYAGVAEPDTFVARNTGRQTLEAAGIRFVHVPGLEDEILAVAKAGHKVEGEA